MEINNNIYGIDIAVYKPRGNKKYQKADIARFLKKFKLYESLQLLGELSHKILTNNEGKPFIEIGKVPISDSILAYLAMCIIENSNDYRNNKFSLNDLSIAADMYYGLPDPVLKDTNLDELLLRFGSALFDYDREINNIVPRSFLLYCILWDEVNEAKIVNINETMQNIVKLNIEEILVFGYAFFGDSERGFFRIFSEEKINNDKDQKLFNEEKQKYFLDWVSCTYKQFRDKSSEMMKLLPSDDYEKNRFNPLIKYPIIIPVFNPRPDLSQIYLVPVSRLLLERVTRGLYFDFADYYKDGNKSNKFREAFGYVFQRYVGHIIEKSKIKVNLLPEWKYNKSQKSTTDWILLYDQEAVFIEVKQSGLFLQAKTISETESIKNDISKTIGQAIQQLWMFEQDVKSKKFKELKNLSNVSNIQRLVITYDRTYFSNSILKKHALKAARERDSSIPKDYDWHTISIEEFERVLTIENISIYDFLKKKNDDTLTSSWDFREYISRKFPQARYINPYLESMKEELIKYVYEKVEKT